MLLPDQQIQQVLNRLTFGARPRDAEQVRAMGIDKWIDLQLNPDRILDPFIDNLTKVTRYSPRPQAISCGSSRILQRLRRQAKRADADTTMDEARDAAGSARAESAARAGRAAHQQIVGEIQSAQLARAVSSERQLNESWSTSGKSLQRLRRQRADSLVLAQYDHDVIRPHALGKFRDLLGAVAHESGDAVLLDNWQSAADSTHPRWRRRGSAEARRLGVGFSGGIGRFLPPRASGC